jgi:hypothetical protein
MIEFFLSAPFVLSAIIVIIVAIAVLLEFEKEGWATTLFSLGTALTLWVYKGIIWDVVSSNPLPIVCFAIAYVVAGLCWSLFKWKFYIGKRTETFNLAKQKFIDSNGEIKNNWKGWITYLNDTVLYTLNVGSAFFESNTPEQVVAKIIPKANSKKSLIVSWISYWPMSLGATLLNNPFRKFFEWIYSLVAGIYDKMGNAETSKMLGGIEKNEDEDSDKKKKVLKG